jgi:hypothetical protein
MNKKTVTLPISNKKIFRDLAEFAFKVENLPQEEKEDFIEDVMNQLAKEAFLFSFTPSGEIGDNPQTPRISETFYDNFPDLFGSKGLITKVLGQNTESDRVLKNRMHRFKSSIINLIQLYLESAFKLKTNDRPKTDRKSNRQRLTSFNYPQISGNKTEADYEKLNEVEYHRYVRLFVATIFFVTISKLIELDIVEMARVIDSLDLTRTKDIPSQKAKFKVLRDGKTRARFVERVREIWQIKLEAVRDTETTKIVAPTKKGRGRPKKEKPIEFETLSFADIESEDGKNELKKFFSQEGAPKVKLDDESEE